MKIKTIILLIYCLPAYMLASLSNHPSSFNEAVVRGGAKTVGLHISNSISSSLGYSFTIPVEWVKVSQPNGSVPGNGTITVNLIFDAANLTEGKYTTTISLNDPHHGGLSIPIELTVSTTTGIEKQDGIPAAFKLLQNYPNPFNPTTVIGYQLPVDGMVTLKVFDALGREVATLVDEYKRAGVYYSSFNNQQLSAGRQGSALASGVYFYQLKTNQFTQTKKMLLTK